MTLSLRDIDGTPDQLPLPPPTVSRVVADPVGHPRRILTVATDRRAAAFPREPPDFGGLCGSPRVHAVPKCEGVRVGRRHIEWLMRQAVLAGVSPRRAGRGFTRRGPDAGLAPDLAQRDFTGPHRTGWGSPARP